jgi:hypothetical protein
MRILEQQIGDEEHTDANAEHRRRQSHLGRQGGGREADVHAVYRVDERQQRDRQQQVQDGASIDRVGQASPGARSY